LKDSDSENNPYKAPSPIEIKGIRWAVLIIVIFVLLRIIAAIIGVPIREHGNASGANFTQFLLFEQELFVGSFRYPEHPRSEYIAVSVFVLSFFVGVLAVAGIFNKSKSQLKEEDKGNGIFGELSDESFGKLSLIVRYTALGGAVICLFMTVFVSAPAFVAAVANPGRVKMSEASLFSDLLFGVVSAGVCGIVVAISGEPHASIAARADRNRISDLRVKHVLVSHLYPALIAQEKHQRYGSRCSWCGSEMLDRCCAASVEKWKGRLFSLLIRSLAVFVLLLPEVSYCVIMRGGAGGIGRSVVESVNVLVFMVGAAVARSVVALDRLFIRTPITAWLLLILLEFLAFSYLFMTSSLDFLLLSGGTSTIAQVICIALGFVVSLFAMIVFWRIMHFRAFKMSKFRPEVPCAAMTERMYRRKDFVWLVHNPRMTRFSLYITTTDEQQKLRMRIRDGNFVERIKWPESETNVPHCQLEVPGCGCSMN
jgi:hypothetical protein